MIQPRHPITRAGSAIALALIVVAAVLMAGCTTQTTDSAATAIPTPNLASPASAVLPATLPATLPANVTVTKLEVFHFHPTRQCISCITIGDYANATLNTYFADDLASGKIVFRHINGELEENRAVVEQYGATGSSLWLGVYTSDGRFFAEENQKVWYRTDEQQKFMDYLRGVIEKRLAGDLSPA